MLFLSGAPGSSVHDLTIRIPEGVTTAEYRGLTTRNDARRIDVVGDAPQSVDTRGVMLASGGTLSDSTVSMSGKVTVGVWMQPAAPSGETIVVRDSTVTAATGVYSQGGGRVERLSIAGIGPGIVALGGYTKVESSLVRVSTSISDAVVALPGSPEPRSGLRTTRS